MRKLMLLAIMSLMLLSCGDDDATAPEPSNNPPVITAVSANPDPVPLNLTTTLSVTATDADGDALSCEWQAAAGTFPAGNTSTQVTWIPPETEAEYSISVAVSDGTVSVDTTILLEVIGAIAMHGLSGQVTNQSDSAATSLYVVITDAYSNTDSSLTDENGNYSFPDLPEGAISMSLRSSEIIVHVLPRYIEKDTTISLTEDLVVDLDVQEFNTIFHDDGTQASEWDMYGAVSNDGTKYIFENSEEFDYMGNRHDQLVPSNADIQNLGFLLRGVAGPSDSSAIRTNIAVNGEYYTHPAWVSIFHTTASYYWGSLENSVLPGDEIRLYPTTFWEHAANFVYIDDIWIFNY